VPRRTGSKNNFSRLCEQIGTTMKNLLSALAAAALAFAPVVSGFLLTTTPSVVVGGDDSVKTALFMTKKYPAGKPFTGQVDEDMAMWYEDKDGNKKKALQKPVGGRPVDLYTKEDIERIDKRNDWWIKPKAYLEWLFQRPTRGY
jgi:hypothetical protein